MPVAIRTVTDCSVNPAWGNDKKEPEQQYKVRKNYQRFSDLPSERQQQAHERWQNISPDECKVIRQQLENMTPEEREALR